jgi:deoxyribonuclease-4
MSPPSACSSSEIRGTPRASAAPPIGAHVSIAGGLDRVLPRARKIEAEVVQIFPSNPRQWRSPSPSRPPLEDFGGALRSAGVPLFLHTIYLINLASPDLSLRQRSAAALADALVFGAHAGASGVVTHIGHHRGEGFPAGVAYVAETVAMARTRAADEAGPTALPPLLLEVGSGSRRSLGNDPGEIAVLLDRLPADTGVCLDTAHLFAGGHPVHTAAGLEEFLGAMAEQLGRGRIGLVHLNDCGSALGSRRDRHENLWEGGLGREGLRLWVRHPQLRQVPFVLETPGFSQEGPDLRNVRRAKRLRAAR